MFTLYSAYSPLYTTSQWAPKKHVWVRQRCSEPAPSFVLCSGTKYFEPSRVPTATTAYIYFIGCCQLVQRRYYSLGTVFVTNTSRGRTSSAGRCDYILRSDGVVLIKKTYRKGIPKYQPLESVTREYTTHYNILVKPEF